MPGLLGPTNPVPGYEPPQPVRVTVPPPTDTTVQNIVDPDRVVRADGKTEQQDAGDSTGAARYESNFMTFLQRLRTAQNLPQTFMRLLQWGGVQVSSGIQEGFAQELAEFLDFLQLDEGQLLSFLQNQMESASRFSGALFAILRDAYGASQSDGARSAILQFLRRYSDFSSTEHIEGKMLRETADLAQSIPSPWSQQAEEILSRMQNGVDAGDREGNLKLLRGQLFPLISRYVSTTHDHGRARTLLTYLTLDVARYENGSTDGLLRAFRHLSSVRILPDELGKLSDEEILRLLRESDFTKAARNNAFADHIAELTNQALRGRGGADAQEVFHNIMASLLINESVYMPLTHAMIPLDWNGNRMFSELWLDPDAEGDGGAGSGGEKSMRLLIKLDMESLGAFDLLFNIKGESVSLQAACPQSVAAFSEQVSRTLGAILTRNGLQAADIRVTPMRRPVAVSDVFPRIYQRMTGVNVKV